MRGRRALLPALTALVFSVASAQAQPVSGVYVAAGAGVNFRNDLSGSGLSLGTDGAGLAALGAIGWGLGNGFRLEIEGSARLNDLDSIALGGRTSAGNGSLRTYGLMANALFDFDLSGFGLQPDVVMPYVGGGIGVAWNEIRDVRFTAGGSRFRIDDTEARLGYQGMAGAALGLGRLLPGLALTAEYRFFGSVAPSFEVSRVSGPPVAGVPASFKPDNVNHSVLLGLRYSFGSPGAVAATEPPGPAAPSVARTFLVFFDWDRAELTSRAREIIGEAAQASLRVETTRIEVAGHADRSGTVQHNQRLSQRRADAVAAELVGHGVPRTAITITALGETRPLVPTADGVREPQNRRVEIVLR
jgi:outer membrane protein OmpA-like peptidoglycan-associated protein